MTTVLEREHRPTAPDLSPLFTRRPSLPLGATPSPGGVNFSVFSRTRPAIELLLFDREDDAEPARVDRARPRRQPHLPLLARRSCRA